MQPASEKVRAYFVLMQKSIKLMVSLEEALDEVYRSSMKMDHEATHKANGEIVALSQELSSLHDARLEIANGFGCTGQKFSFELADKLPEKLGKQLHDISTDLMARMYQCQEKMNMHSEQLQLQKQIVSEAVESLNLTVTA